MQRGTLVAFCQQLHNLRIDVRLDVRLDGGLCLPPIQNVSHSLRRAMDPVGACPERVHGPGHRGPAAVLVGIRAIVSRAGGFPSQGGADLIEEDAGSALVALPSPPRAGQQQITARPGDCDVGQPSLLRGEVIFDGCLELRDLGP